MNLYIRIDSGCSNYRNMEIKNPAHIRCRAVLLTIATSRVTVSALHLRSPIRFLPLLTGELLRRKTAYFKLSGQITCSAG